jgi:FdhE protein
VKSVIEEIIKQKPHLAEPLRFYDKAVQFIDLARKLPLSPGPTQIAYAPGMIDQIFVRFSSCIELPEGSLSPLKQAMELGEIDFTRLPLDEVPAFSLPYPEDDLSMLLFLLSKPYFLALRDACRLDERTWAEGKCPVCNARPSVTWVRDDGRRLVSCSYCGTIGLINRAGCPVCQTVEAAKQNILVFEHEEGFKINTCDLCRSYVKTIDAGMIARLTPEISDLASLPQDIVVQEKGYARRSPNPIGMKKMSTRG